MTTEVLTYGLSYLNFMHFHLFSIFMAYVLDVTTWVFVFLTLGPKKFTAVFCNKGYILKPCICGGILYIYGHAPPNDVLVNWQSTYTVVVS